MGTFEMRLNAWIKRLEKAGSCASQQEAYELLKTEWISVCSTFGLPRKYLAIAAQHQLCKSDGWTLMSDGTCYRDSADEPSVRTYIHSDGAIVLQRIKSGGSLILFNLPSANNRLMQPIKIAA